MTAVSSGGACQGGRRALQSATQPIVELNVIYLKTLLVVLSPLWLWAGVSRAELPETQLKYRITADLDPATRKLKGKVILRWQGPKERGLKTIPLHLYLNAFAHEQTTWMRSARSGRQANDRFLKQYPDPWGYIESMTVRQRADGELRDAKWQAIRPDDNNPLDRSLVEVVLPKPLEPGATLLLEIDYVARLPITIARTGCTTDFCLVAQWYPKLGMYERVRAVPSSVPSMGTEQKVQGTWAARQFHGQTEFYAEFADYDVTIRAPKGWQIAATGLRQGKAKVTGSVQWEHRFVQRAVHDFTFALGNTMELHRATHQLSDHPVALQFMMPKGLAHQFPRWKKSVTGAMDQLEKFVGPYPYGSLTVVMPNWRARRTGGMEYPTLITGETADTLEDHFLLRHLRFGEFTLIHEYIHQYFYGLLASNEQQEAYLDEGFNTYWSVRIAWALYGRKSSFGNLLGRSMDIGDWAIRRIETGRNKIREPIGKRPAALFYPGSSGNQIYMRPAVAWLTAEGLFGRDNIDRVFAEYYRRFAFRHPNGADFLTVVRDTAGEEMHGFFREAFTQTSVPDYRVVKVSSERWNAPLGRLELKEGATVVTEANRKMTTKESVDSDLAQADHVRVEITEPGYVGANAQVDGKVFRQTLKPSSTAPGEKPQAKPEVEKAAPQEFYESQVRLVGPGWRHLPVVVRFVFEDERTVDDTWDGRSTWRAYRFVRGAKLRKVIIDPEGKIFMDARPQNNSRSREPDAAFTRDWGYWLGAAGNWLVEAAALWL